MTEKTTTEITKGKNLPVRIEVVKDKSGNVIKQKSVHIPRVYRINGDK